MIRVQGVIERRLLVNYRLDPDVATRFLPAPFRPQLFGGHAIVGICLIRLGGIRPGFVPSALGLRSENAAHRFAVEWHSGGETKCGVYIPRRDTSLWLNTVVGGRMFPGVHHRAEFDVSESEDAYRIAFTSEDGTSLAVEGAPSNAFPASSVFGSLESSSEFFRKGSLGYSPGFRPGDLQGLELVTDSWKVRPFEVRRAESSFFADERAFPKGSVSFDHALLMRDLPHSWKAHGAP